MNSTVYRTVIGLSASAALAAAVASCQSPAGPAAAAIQPTYTDIAAKVFSANCTTSSCHGTQGGKGALILTSDVAYENLVNVKPDNDTAAAAGLKRVVPGDAANSFLLLKLTGPGPGEGDLMPQVGPPLDAGTIAAIKTWIANGALKN